MSTKYEQHKKEWSNCQNCPLCNSRRNVVFAKGQLPADILVLGEFPGDSEDVLGKSFAGPASRLIEAIIDSSLDLLKENCHSVLLEEVRQLKVAYYYGIGCKPKDWTDGHLLNIASDACSIRLTEFLLLCKPSLIITFGTFASRTARMSMTSTELKKSSTQILPFNAMTFFTNSPVVTKGLLIQNTATTIAETIYKEILIPF